MDLFCKNKENVHDVNVISLSSVGIYAFFNKYACNQWSVKALRKGENKIIIQFKCFSLITLKTVNAYHF